MNKRYWRIRGYDSTTLIFDETASLGDFNESRIQLLLQVLAAKEGLSYREIVGALARRGASISNDLLSVRKDFSQPTWMCGSNPHFTATVVDESGKIITPRKDALSRPSGLDTVAGGSGPSGTSL
ncbi:MAG: hypothetical protein EPN47_13430 [Acidobacteria bacterium]|nr:MAG: hypothetical protein EPN47_13430 [Acidobacteriota bacterium]